MRRAVEHQIKRDFRHDDENTGSCQRLNHDHPRAIKSQPNHGIAVAAWRIGPAAVFVGRIGPFEPIVVRRPVGRPFDLVEPLRNLQNLIALIRSTAPFKAPMMAISGRCNWFRGAWSMTNEGTVPRSRKCVRRPACIGAILARGRHRAGAASGASGDLVHRFFGRILRKILGQIRLGVHGGCNGRRRCAKTRGAVIGMA